MLNMTDSVDGFHATQHCHYHFPTKIKQLQLLYLNAPSGTLVANNLPGTEHGRCHVYVYLNCDHSKGG